MTGSHDRIADIIALAVHAPSGDNAQPWKFKVSGNAVSIYNIPEKDSSPYNFRERGSFFAHGALMENMVIAASSFGYAASAALFPVAGDRHLVARVTFEEKKNMAVDPLAESIRSRATNRKPYRKEPLHPDHRNALMRVAGDGGTIKLVEDAQEIGRIAKMISLSDRLIFEDKEIHDAIFGSVRWTESEERSHRGGLYIKTLELPPPAQMMFRLFRHWPFLRAANRLQAAKAIAHESAKNYAASSAIGALMIPGDTPEHFARAGRLFERFWLTATASGVSLQPITALAYLAKRVAAGEPGKLSAAHQRLILQAEQDIRSAFGNPDGTIAMLFRVGYGDKPTAQSRKSTPEIIYEQ